VTELDELCSFLSAPQEDYRDLNWWPAVLKRVWELARVDAQTLAVLRRGLDGDGEVNPAYRDHPDTIWEHPVTFLEPDGVGEIADALRTLDPEAIRAAVPPNSDHTDAVIGSMYREGLDNLPEHVAKQFATLRDFYDEAVRRRLAVVLWWD
jgi:hypothetical protein